MQRMQPSGRRPNTTAGITSFPQFYRPRTSGPRPFSPSENDTPIQAREELMWNTQRMASYKWLEPFVDVPDDAAPPLYMSPPAPDAVGSYGAQAIRWIELTQTDKSGRPLTLRWWQALAITRQLEHREDGSLCYRTVVESCPRRAGKSVRMRTLAVWRMNNPHLFGEIQTIVHTGSDIAVCEEIQRDAWRWCEDVMAWKVTRANGRRAIETPDGDRWVVKAQEAAGYSFDVTLGIVDEAWNVKPETVDEGLEPASLERLSAQIYITSTAHRRATSLMRTQLQTALTMDDPTTLLMLWAAKQGADPGDPEVWRAASPYWSEDRRSMIDKKYSKVLAGELDPQADDPDPMAGFTAQYLNIWQLNVALRQKGLPLIEKEAWLSRTVEPPAAVPQSAAIESWFAEGVSLALAWKEGSRAIVSVKDYADLEEAAAALKDSGFRGTATVGASLVEDPALQGIRCTKGQGLVSASVREFQRLLSEDGVWHDGGDELTSQVLKARTVNGPDGPRMVSTGRADAIKAALWAVLACRKKSVGKPRILYAR